MSSHIKVPGKMSRFMHTEPTFCIAWSVLSQRWQILDSFWHVLQFRTLRLMYLHPVPVLYDQVLYGKIK